MGWWNKVSARFGRKADPAVENPYGFGADKPRDVSSSASPARRKWRWRFGGAGALLLLIALYYLLGGLLLSRIDRNLAFRPSAADLPARGSETVATMSGLLEREIRGGWTPSVPWFYPNAFIDDKPNFQIGMLRMFRAASLELRDSIGRLRGSGGTDDDLEKVVSTLNYRPDMWYVSASAPYIGSTSQGNYKDAVKALRRYNARVAAGQATYERRNDTLARMIDRAALSLGAASSEIEKRIAVPGGLFDSKADDDFYRAQGQCYAAYMLFSSLRNDYADAIRQRAAANLWAEMADELRQCVTIRPLIVSNGDTGSTFVQNHLSTIGLHVERARQRMRELYGVLQ